MPHSCAVPNLVGHTIDHGGLLLTEVVGSGSNGVVFLAKDLKSGTPPTEYAVKCLVRGQRGTRRYALQQREIMFHSELSAHPNIVTLHRVIEYKHYLFLVMDYCRGRDFFIFLSKRKDYRGDDRFVKRMFLQVLDAVEACHKAGVYHRDIKPENFLVNEDGTQLYLTDFGLATPHLLSSMYGAGSSLYMSPECIGEDCNAKTPYNTGANDIWALGVVFTSMISGHNPWHKAIVSDPCFRAFNVNRNFFRDMLPISADGNRLLQQIFRHERTRCITLAQIRAAVEATETFFMRPNEIACAGLYIKLAAQSYFVGSRLEDHYITWSPLLTEDGKHVDVGIQEQKKADKDERDDDDEICEQPRSVVENSDSQASTVETDGPNTPELRAQSLHASVVGLPDDSFLPCDMQFAPSVAKLPKRHQHASSGFLRRFMDKFFADRVE